MKKCIYCSECQKELHSGDSVWFDEEDACTVVCDDCNKTYGYSESEVLDEESIESLLEVIEGEE